MSYTISDFLKSRIHQQRQPSPILHLYQVELPDGTFLRYVDFMDHTGGAALPTQIMFDGNAFTARRISHGEIPFDSQNIRPQVTVTVGDMDHSGAFYLRAHNGITGCRVTMWITAYDRLSTPADAFQSTFYVLNSSIVQDPPSITLTLGMRNLYEAKFPRLFYDRRRCFNSFQDRNLAGNWCRYPSNEFGPSTAQDYRVGASDEVQLRRHGWYSQQAARSYSFVSGTNSVLTMETRDTYASWYDKDRHGPNLFRVLTGDFDVSTLISSQVTTRSGFTFGILVQDETVAAPDPSEQNPPTPESSWLLWALNDAGGGSKRLLKRTTSADFSVDTTYAYNHTFLRISRVGNVYTLYSKAAEGDTWTQHWSGTWTSVGTTARVGLVVCSRTQSTDRLAASFSYIRFTVGGYTTCNRSWEDCVARQNEYQFNGFREIPNNRAMS